MIKIYKRKEINLLEIAVRMKGGCTRPMWPDHQLEIPRNSWKETHKYPKLAKFLIEHDNLNNKLKVRLFVTENSGWIVEDAIELAAFFGFTEVVKKLNNKSNTPLKGWSEISLAAMCGHLNTIKYLVSIADTSVAPEYPFIIFSPLYIAASMGHQDIVKYLVDLLSTSVLFPNGRTDRDEIIQAARQNGCVEVVEFLEEHYQDTLND